jgi:hypothetical protein
MDNKWAYITLIYAWLITGIVVGITIYVTKNGSYLCIMLVPALLIFKLMDDNQ